ncbi:putative Ig domain-containing protein [Kribbella sp. CA-245084]|uniref:putative Ig domain-containing protein n=1 Tax=Kribbella sp. CA-245084 TaxID=3239940 RepID=UPI003D93DAF9
MPPNRSRVAGVVTALLAMLVPFLTLPNASAEASDSAATSPGGDSGLMTDTLVAINGTTSSAGFIHPGIGVTAANLVNARKEVRAGVEPWKSSFDAMNASAYASRTLVSRNASPMLDQPSDPSFTSQGTESKLIADSAGAYAQAIDYVMTGDNIYRANAMKIIRIWSNMDPARYAYYADAQIHSGVPLYRLLSAAELLRYTSYDAGYTDYDLAWHDSDTAKLTTNLIDPMTKVFLYKNTNYYNQHTYPLIGALAGYIFTDNRARYNEGVEWFTVNATTTKPEQNGALAAIFPLISKNDPLNPYGYSFVQHQEMGRDQAHSGGDVDCLAGLARIVSMQGTKVDPVHGTVSTAANAVDPYRFRDNRLLAGANAFAKYMLGYDTPWIDTSGGPGAISPAYRGRMFYLTEINEIYNTYKYVEHVNVEAEAPYLAKAHEQAPGPLFYTGTTLNNFWSTVDTGPEYWLSFPHQLAGQAPPTAADGNVQVEQRGVTLGSGTVMRTSGGRTYAEMHASAKGTTLVVHDLAYADQSKYSPVGLMIRTNASSVRLAVAKDQHTQAFHTMTLPNTHGAWRYVTYDVSNAAVQPNRMGDNIGYYTVTGPKGATADVDYVNTSVGQQFTPPAFPQGQTADVIGVANEPLTASFAATDANTADTVSYTAEGLPAGAQLDPATGAFTWTPTKKQSGTHRFVVVADDGTIDTVLEVTVHAERDRQGAYQQALTGYDSKQTYTTASLAAFTKVADQVEASIPTASDADFIASLATLQASIRALQLLNPVLADDGSLAYPSLVTSSLSPLSLSSMVDGDYNTTSGDLRAPFSIDFGIGYRVSATAFGLQARYNFPNRSQGANVYGSNDGQTWTLLTSRETTDTTSSNFAIETIPVRSEVQGQSFRFFKVQVDDPGVPNDPAYPGLSSFSEFRIHGTRAETVQAVSSVHLSSNNPVAGQAVNGDTVALDLASTQPLATLNASIEGVSATVTNTDNEHWHATAVLPENVDYGRALQFTAEYTTTDGRIGATVFQTTDGSSLQLWNTHVKVAGISQAWVDASTPAWPGTGTTAANGWRMFDGDITTSTDTTTSNGWVTVVPTDGSSLSFDAVRVHARSTYANRANGTVLQGSTDGGATWQTFLTISGVTSDQQWYTFTLPKHESVPMLRVLDEHGGNTNVAEVQLLQFDQPAS